MTTTQFPSESNPGVPQETSYNSRDVANTQKLKLPDEYICLKDILFGCNSPLFARVCTSNVGYNMTTHNQHNLGKTNELAWLQSVSKANEDNCFPWTKFHSNLETEKSKPLLRLTL